VSGASSPDWPHPGGAHCVSVRLLLRALINTQSLLRLRISSHTNTFSRNPIRPFVVVVALVYIQLACLLIKKGSVRLSFIIARLHFLALSLFPSQSAAACGSGKEEQPADFHWSEPCQLNAVIRSGSAVKNCDHHSSNCFWHFGVWRADSCSNSIWPRIGFLVYTMPLTRRTCMMVGGSLSALDFEFPLIHSHPPFLRASFPPACQ